MTHTDYHTTDHKKPTTAGLTEDEASELLRKTRLAHEQLLRTTLNESFRAVAANLHSERQLSFAYAPTRGGHVVHAYINPDQPGFKAKLGEYTTKKTTFKDFEAWQTNPGRDYQNAYNQKRVTTQLRDDIQRNQPSFDHVNRYS